MKEELQEEGRALSWCSSYMPVLAKFVSRQAAQNLDVLAVTMRNKSIAVLKAKLEKPARNVMKDNDISILAQIVSLFRAACKVRKSAKLLLVLTQTASLTHEQEGDMIGAKVHANAIEHLVDQVQTPNNHFRTLLITCINNDVELAITHMKSTIFKYQGWIHQQIQRFWKETPANTMPSMPWVSDALHPSMNTPVVQEAAIRVRRYLSIRSTPINLDDPEDLDRVDALSTAIAIYTQYDCGALINAYIGMLEQSNTKSIRQQLQGCLALTTLYVLRRGVLEATIQGSERSRNSSHTAIMQYLESSLKRACSDARPNELTEYSEALLWMFFCGARYEWRMFQSETAPSSGRAWFSKVFAQQARILHLSDWRLAKEVIECFILCEFLEADLDSWFAEMLEDNGY
jgi:hypothetical protein